MIGPILALTSRCHFWFTSDRRPLLLSRTRQGSKLVTVSQNGSPAVPRDDGGVVSGLNNELTRFCGRS